MSPTDEGSSARAQAIHVVLDQCVDRLAEGESLTKEQVIAAHRDLMPELGDELRKLSLIERAQRRARADDSSSGLGAMADADAARPAKNADMIPGYKMLSELHRGGQGIVYQAVQRSTGRRVAIKVMREGPFAGSADKIRFDREVHILGQLNHPNIVGIHDSGEAAEHIYYVMDYISGQSLDAYMAGTDRAIDDTLRLFAKICDAVNAAHLHGIIHRDLKPGNIRIDDDGEPHILDFGLAKVPTSESDASAMTMTGQFVGSLPWSSPEQAEGRPGMIDVRTDVYSLGVLLYQMLTGRFPYDVTGSLRDALDRIVKSKPVRPSTIRRQVNDELNAIVLKCLAKKREQRYQTAGELSRDMHHYLAGEPLEARRGSSWYMLKKTLSRQKATVAVACAFVLLTAASAIAFGFLYRMADQQKVLAQQAQRQAEAQAETLRRSVYANNIALAQSALEKENTANLVRLLDECPADLRGWEWYYLKRLSDTSIMTLRGHKAGIEGLAFSPDGSKIASGGGDNTVKLWDAHTGDELRTLTGHTRFVKSVAFSPGGKLLASGSDDFTVRLWNVKTGETVRELRGHEHFVQGVDFSPDGRTVVSGSEDGTLKLWDADSGREITTLHGHDGPVLCVDFSPDGQRIASGSHDCTVKLWDVATGEEIRTLTGPGGWVLYMAFNSDGSRIVASAEGRLWVWDADTGASIMTIETGGLYARGAVFSPDGRLIVAAVDLVIKAWDTAMGQQTSARLGHRHLVGPVEFSPNGGRLVSADHDWTIGHPGLVKLWDMNLSAEARALRGHTDTVPAAGVSPDGTRIASGSWDKTIRVWDAASGQQLLELTGHDGWVESVVFSSDGRWIVSGARDRTVRIWDAQTGAHVRTLQGHNAFVMAAAISPDNRHIASGGWDKIIKVWDAESGHLVSSLSGHTSRIEALSYSSDGRYILSASSDRSLGIWEAETGRRVHEGLGHGSAVLTAAFSPDGKLIASGGRDGTIRVWDVANGELLQDLWGHHRAAKGIAFSPDGQRIVSGSSDRCVSVWDVQTGKLLLTLAGHEASVNSIAFSPNGRWFVSGSSDHTLRIWDAGPEYVASSGDEEH